MRNLGRTVAPPRFLAFGLGLPVAVALFALRLDLGRALMAGFDIASAAFLLSLMPLLGDADADRMRDASRANDANRTLLLALTGAVMLVVLAAVAAELDGRGGRAGAALVIATLALAWLFSNTVYALHYAHLYYGDRNGRAGDDAGLEVPHCAEPDYGDFLYFAFTLGMTFQTSDVQVTARGMRRVVLGHSLAAFVFNLGVLAFTINVLGGG